MKRHLTILFLLLVSIGFAQERRLALVVGNSEYVEKGHYLENPVNDANDVSAKLNTLGFEVTKLINGSYLEMDDAIDAFSRKAKNYDVALFYYAGHGLQAKGNNYMQPVDVELRSEAEVQFKCYSLDMLIAKLAESGCPMKIIVLDACRDNPFERSWHRGAGSKGFSQVKAPTGTLIAYATAPGRTAEDGTGRNSPYTSAFLESLDVPNLSLGDFFDNVGTLVLGKTNDEQEPWYSKSASNNSRFYFNKKATPAPSVVQAPTPTTPTPQPTPQKPSTTQPQPETVSAPVNANSHEYVDLGLPSGTLWATCNIGASKPEEYGNYYAWGETSNKSAYNWYTNKYANGSSDKLTKYCSKSDYGNNGFIDNLTTLQSGDDPATASWGSGWQTPSKAQWDELLANTTNQCTTRNGVVGRLFTSRKNGQTLFLPAAGYRWDSALHYPSADGDYWSRSLDTDNPSIAWYLNFDRRSSCYMRTGIRSRGSTVRPVLQK